MANILQNLIENENQRLRNYMEFNFGFTSWYKHIKQMSVTKNRVIVSTNVEPHESYLVRYIPTAIFSWCNDKTVNDKRSVKHVVILDKHDKELMKISNPVNRGYFKR